MKYQFGCTKWISLLPQQGFQYHIPDFPFSPRLGGGDAGLLRYFPFHLHFIDSAVDNFAKRPAISYGSIRESAFDITNLVKDD